MDTVTSHYFTTSDGVKLHYLQAGEGDTLLMLPGAGLTAKIFAAQIKSFSNHYKVIALDKRGHGESEKVDFGYRVSRFAKDLRDLLLILELNNIILLAHSLGAGMSYNYIDQFGTKLVSKFIVVDEPPALLINPAWSEEERKNYGAIYDASTIHRLTNGFSQENFHALNTKIVNEMTTKYAHQEQKQFILDCIDIPGEAASKLYLNNICQDFRDVMKKIDIPTLLITGKASLHPWQSHQWMHKQISNSALEIFSEKEGGNHFMFIENSEKFNTIVSKFLQSS